MTMRLQNLRRILIALAAAAVQACSAKHDDRTATVPVRSAMVSRISAPVVISANGIVEPLQTVDVEAQVGGIVTEVAFHEGDEVTAGQVLFRIDPRPLEAALRQAQAALARDIAQAANAQRDAERYRALVAKDYVTKSQADQADANATALYATVRADSATVESATLNLGYATIRAPIAGRTGGLLVRQGNVVKANGEPLVVINQLEPILVRFPVAQADFPGLAQRIGRRRVSVTASIADGSPVTGDGGVTFVDNAVDSLTGTVTAKAEFQNASRQLWPGAFVSVTVRLDVIANALAVPTTALQNGQDGPYLYVIDDSGRARIRKVKPAQASGDLTVLMSGVSEGERVVSDGQSRLVPGIKVEVQPAAATPGTR